MLTPQKLASEGRRFVLVTDMIYYNDGDESEGEWVDGKRCGILTSIWPDGTKYIGNWEDDKRVGRGTYYFTDGTVVTGEYVNDEWVPDKPVKPL